MDQDNLVEAYAINSFMIYEIEEKMEPHIQALNQEKPDSYQKQIETDDGDVNMQNIEENAFGIQKRSQRFSLKLFMPSPSINTSTGNGNGNGKGKGNGVIPNNKGEIQAFPSREERKNEMFLRTQIIKVNPKEYYDINDHKPNKDYEIIDLSNE